jgi:Domain of unknown function (DUF4397)
VIALLALLALPLGIPAIATASSAATNSGWIRLGNLAPATSPVDLYVFSSGNSVAQVIVRDVGYGSVSSYNVVGAGAYSVQTRTAGSSASSPSVLSGSVTVQAGQAYTVVTLAAASQAGQLKVLNDSLTAPPGKSLVRVIQASKNQQVTFHCSCAAGAPGNITTNASSGSVSSYATIPPGTWTMTATGTSAAASMPITLAPNTVHTEVVVDKAGRIGIVDLLDAAGAGQPAQGGTNAGFGGTAPHGPGGPLPWLVAISTGALLILGGGLGLRRNKAHRLTTGL